MTDPVTPLPIGHGPEELDQFFADHPLGYWRVDGQGRIQAVNEAYCRISGLRSDEILGRPVTDLVSGVSLEEVAARIHQVVLTGISRFTGQHLAINAQSFPVEVQVVWIPRLEQTIAFLKGLIEPSEASALDSRGSRFRRLVESQGDGFTIVDIDERITFANAASEGIFGVPRGTLVGRSLHDFLDPEQARVVIEKTLERQAGKEESYELWIRRLDGTPRLLHVTVTRELDDAGQYLGSVGVFSDITDQRRAEERVRASEARFRTLIDDAPMAIAMTRDERFLHVNRRFLEMHGFDRIEELVGQSVHDLIHSEDRDLVEQYRLRPDGESARTRELTFRTVHRNGRILMLHCWLRPILLDDGLANLGFFEDITLQREAEAERERLFRDLTQALDEVQQLTGLLPICSYCKKVRDDKGYWNQIEAYVSRHTSAQFSHGICPDCAREHFPDVFKRSQG